LQKKKKIFKMQLHTINTGNFKLDGGAMFGVVPKSIWHKLNPADSNNMCNWAMRCMLIEDGNKLILIDTGIGNKQSEKFYSHYYLHGDASLENSLKEKGFHKEDITDVFLTHLHFDHCGGAIISDGEKYIPAFINATYWSNADHWQWAVQPNDREKASFLKENILPIQESGQLKFIDAHTNIGITESVPFVHNVAIKFAKGHTESMMLPVINYKGHNIVYMADLLPSVAHLPLPYIMAYDMFPMKTLTEKKAFLNQAVENNYLLYFEHDPVNELCSLTTNERGNVVVNKLMHLSEL
jgi:glyoxylase-like metal-dependent hydrolase (beta-lactamase superfamily II)